MPTRALYMRRVRELIRLKYEARLSHEQIAGALAISKGVVAKYVARIERARPEPPTPKSANAAIANNELMVIKRPKRSLPRYLSVRRTIISDVTTWTTRTSADALLVTMARRFPSAPRVTSSALAKSPAESNLRKRCIALEINQPPLTAISGPGGLQR
jgi:hypothetical protein